MSRVLRSISVEHHNTCVDISNTITNKRFKPYPSKALEIFGTSLSIA